MTSTQVASAQTINETIIASPCQAFLESVAVYADLDSTYDARDISEVVFRSIRDLMPTEAVQLIATELEEIEAEFSPQSTTLAQLWRDTNPLVRWLSQVRPPLDVKDTVFQRRIQQEAGIPKHVDSSDVILAVFRSFKKVLSSEARGQIAQYLPGQIRYTWNRA